MNSDRFNTVTTNADFLDEEDIVAKLHFVEEMEDRWRYGSAGDVSFIDRVWDSLARIPADLQQYALAIFANTVYLPQPLLREGLTHLAEEAATALAISVDDLFANSLLLEVDPSGLVNDFVHENVVPGRLDTDRFPRVGSVSQLATALLMVSRGIGDRNMIEVALSKPYWIILSDNVLSGTSVASDLGRAARLAEAFRPGEPTTLLALAQVLTSDAEDVLKKTLSEVRVLHALYFDKRFKVAPDNRECALFKSPTTLDGVVRVCHWLSEQSWFTQDPQLRPTISQSGDGMVFGYKGGGWPIITPNAPTNSLPILWYKNQEHYVAPFPRVMSRTSQSKGNSGPIVDEALDASRQILALLGRSTT